MARGSADKIDKSDTRFVIRRTGYSQSALHPLQVLGDGIGAMRAGIPAALAEKSCPGEHRTVSENQRKLCGANKTCCGCHNCGLSAGYLPIRRMGLPIMRVLRIILPVLAVPALLVSTLMVLLRHE
jgi:hypothetical protein